MEEKVYVCNLVSSCSVKMPIHCLDTMVANVWLDLLDENIPSGGAKGYVTNFNIKVINLFTRRRGTTLHHVGDGNRSHTSLYRVRLTITR